MNPGHMEASFWDSGYSFGLGLVVPGCPKQFVKAVREGRGVACDFCRVSLVTSVPVSLVTSQSLPLQNAAVSCSWLCTWRDSLSWPTHGFSAPRAVQLWDRKR